MALTIEEVLERIGRGDPPSAIAADLADDSERALLRRCALVRSFDRDVVDAVLRRLPNEIVSGAASFESLTSWPYVRRVPGEDATFRMEDVERVRLLGEWSDPEEVHTLDLALIDHYRARPLERLYHLGYVDPEAAFRRFDRWFRLADLAFNLARCQDLVGLFSESDARLAPPLLAQARDDRRAHLAGRGMWIDDYYRTTHFVERAALTTAVESLLSPSGPRVLQIFAMGGRGKTQLLRWMLSRRCSRRGIACARIDFDRRGEYAAELTSSPWKLVKELARQFDRQLPGQPLAELLSSLATDVSGDSLPILQRFTSILTEASSGTGGGDRPPIVIVLDTLEDVLIPHPKALVNLLEMIQELRRHVPGLRLILSGRYDLRDEAKLGATLPFLDSDRLDLEIPPFDPREAREYLVEKLGLDRRLRVPNDVIEAVITRAEGIPLRLTLYAEILAAEPELSADRVLSDPRVEIAHLIRRVILRIDDIRIRLVLRYSAVRGSLDLAFVREVILTRWGELVAADRGSPSLTRDLANAFPAADPPADLDGLWRDLKRYAAKSSWVSIDPPRADEEEESLRLHPEVLNPMQFLLRDEEPEVLRILHTESIRYFEGLSAKGDGHRDEWVAQAVYHDFRLRGAEAGSAFRARIESPDLRVAPKARLALAHVVTGAEFRTDEGTPRTRHDGTPAISASDLAYAYAQIAIAHHELAGDADWTASEDHFKRADEALARMDLAAKGLDGPVVPAARIAPVRAAVWSKTGSKHRALTLLEQVELDSRGPIDEQWIADHMKLLDELARLLAGEGNRQSLSIHRRLFELLDQFPEQTPPGVERVNVGAALANALYDFDVSDQAFDVCDRVLGMDEIRSRPETRAEVEDLRYLAMNRMGRSEEALAQILASSSSNTGAIGKSDRTRTPRASTVARVLLSLGRPIEARAELKRSAETSDPLPPPAPAQRNSRRPILTDEMRGRVAIALMDYREAIGCLERARSAYVSRSDRSAADRSLTLLIRAVCDSGDFETARSLMAQLRPRWPERTTDSVSDLYRFLSEIGDEPEAAAVRRELGDPASDDAEEWSAGALTLGIVSQLNSGGEDHGSVLVRSLRRISPPSARLLALEGLTHQPAIPERFSEHLASNFLDCLPTSEDLRADNHSPGDRTGLLLLQIEAQRVVGDWEAACSSFEEATSLISEDVSLFRLLQMLRAGDRLDLTQQTAAIAESYGDRFLDEFREFPLLRANFLLDQSMRQYQLRNIVGARRSLDLALDMLTPGPSLSQTTASFYRERAEDIRARGASGSPEPRLERMADLGRGDFPIDAPPSQSPSESDGGELVHTSPGFVVRVTSDGLGKVEIENEMPGKPTVSGIEMSGTNLDLLPIDREPLSDFVATLEPLTQERTEWLNQLARELISEPLSAELKQGPARDLRLDFATPAVAAIPWELLLVQGRTSDARNPLEGAGLRYFHRIGPNVPLNLRSEYAWLRATLSEVLRREVGLVHNSLRDTLTKFQRWAGLAPTGTIDAKSRRELDIRARRIRGELAPVVVMIQSHRGDWAASADAERHSASLAYRAAGLIVRHHVIELSNPMESLHQALSRNVPRPSIIHVAAGFDELPSLGPHLRIRVADRKEHAWIAPSMLNHLVSELTPDRSIPLLVLDPLRPAARIEIARQLFLRNAFADSVYRGSNLPGVVAAGLGTNQDAQAMATSFAHSIADGRSLGEAVEIIRRVSLATTVEQSNDVDAPISGPATVALFTNDPDLRLPEVLRE